MQEFCKGKQDVQQASQTGTQSNGIQINQLDHKTKTNAQTSFENKHSITSEED